MSKSQTEDGTSSPQELLLGPLNSRKNQDLWYADGSVVLVADTTAFRVHTSVLAQNCDVFRDMDAIPKPDAVGDLEETYEGCPVINLQDSATDLEYFLKAIYKFSFFRPNKKSKFPVVAAILRLSTKYMANDLRRQAIQFLTTAFPPDYDAWSKRNETRLLPYFVGETAAMITLCQQTGIRVVLPGVYYAAAKRPLSDVLDDLRSLDLDDTTKQDICSKFILGRERLRQAEIKSILSFFEPTFTRATCQSGNDTASLQRYAGTALVRTADPEPYQDWCMSNPALVGTFINVCANCCVTIEMHIEGAKRNIWSQLPGLFGLPDWDILRAEDEVDE
ncbi:hypothetical protein BC835DRAFT_1269081 [Cytidiella melzeri]|nr:hypothetical protein BC835DRAFT_1269081 [Cytidiella melzeri]